jgi:2-polyprenyl-6-methoxyphenol hydroxylase-like FAD-dependent oxidoreductase
MFESPIRSILVVGGGTAGCLSASYLHRAFGETVKVSMVESPTIGRIGVGEATVSTLRHTMSFLGFNEDDWLPAVGGTYKTAVRFEQWNQPPSAGEEHFYHPFFERVEPTVHPLPMYLPEVGDGTSLMHYWHRSHLCGDKTPYAYAVFPGPALCDARKAPRFKDSSAWEVPAAYHLDAHKFGNFLTRKMKERGVAHIVDDVNEVLLDERGAIAGVRTAQNGVLTADLYIDCTGFRSLLLGKALREKFVSAAEYLWNDAAVATRPLNAPGDLEPYTLARACEAGWMWNIPLFHRAGTGYVYCSRYKSQDRAEREIRDYLGARADKDTFVNHLRFTPGRYERTWVKNCVAVGLAGNFIEPLESTTIYLIEYALANLVALFPDRSFAPARARRYNDAMAQMYDEVRDFIVLHFIGSNRRDTPYWRDLTERPRVPDSLAESLEFFKASMPQGERFRNFVFRERSYACLLAGLKKVPSTPNPFIHHFDGSVAKKAFADIKKRTEELVTTLPGQREYLTHIYREAGIEFEAD